MTNKEQLRNQFEKDKGVRCITPKGDGDIRYVEFLESEIEKRDNIISTQSRDINQMVSTIARLGAEIKEAESGRETAP